MDRGLMWRDHPVAQILYGSSIRMTAKRAREAREVADRLAFDAWNGDARLQGTGPALPDVGRSAQRRLISAEEVHSSDRLCGVLIFAGTYALSIRKGY
jgi:hypothetical protein